MCSVDVAKSKAYFGVICYERLRTLLLSNLYINNGNQVENNITIFYNNFHINSHRSPNKAHSNIVFTTPCKKEKTEHKNRARWSTIKDVVIFASYSFQYIPNLCKMPATTPQNVISANITYKRVPSLSEFQTWINKWFWIQLTWENCRFCILIRSVLMKFNH